MRPSAICIEQFRGWYESREPLRLDTPITAIVGENARGKSSLLNAIEWCLFGREVEKKGSGIEERADWEIRPRSGSDAPTRVAVTFEHDGESFIVTRIRRADANARQEDDRIVTLPDGSERRQGDADAWMRAHGVPDWETYRRAHCFHQEVARARVTNLADRNAILATLLGLEGDIRIRDVLAELQGAKLVKEVDDLQAVLERDLLAIADRPRRKLEEVEANLEARGIPRTQLGDAEIEATCRALTDRAREMGTSIGVDPRLPAAADPIAVRAWAERWPTRVRTEAGRLAELKPLVVRRDTVAAALVAAEHREQAWRNCLGSVRLAMEQGGDGDLRSARLDEAKLDLSVASAELKRASALLALIHEARALVSDEDGTPSCPVCETPVAALGAKLDVAVAGLESHGLAPLRERVAAAKAILEERTQAVEEFRLLVASEAGAQREAEQTRLRLMRTLGDETISVGSDVLALARSRIEDWAREIEALERAAAAIEGQLAEHQTGLERLGLLLGWREAVQSTARRLDLSALPEWNELQAAIDDAAAFASDIEALSAVAREAQEERSKSRAAEVNGLIGRYLDLIEGTTLGHGVRVEVKATAKQLEYRLVDQRRREIMPVLNQGALNSLSLAMLLAQAESRARSGRPSWVVMDDPAQSLDPDHQAGLARAVEAVAPHCSVVVATTPGTLADRIRDYVSVPRSLVQLGPWDERRGALVERRETR